MSIFNAILDFITGKPKTVNDPVLGEISFDRRDQSWCGRVKFPGADDYVLLILHAGEDGPSDWHRTRFRELADRYPVIRERIEIGVYQEVKGWFDGHREYNAKHPEAAPDWEVSSVVAPADLWHHLLLNRVEICGNEGVDDSAYRLSYELFDNAQHLADAIANPMKSMADPEHELYVDLLDWQVTSAMIEG
jgi:hypothetical protein